MIEKFKKIIDELEVQRKQYPKMWTEDVIKLIAHLSQEYSAQNNSKESTGVFTKDGHQICVDDRVITGQGTEFVVIKLENAEGIKYALHDGQRPYDLHKWMGDNLWLVGSKDSKPEQSGSLPVEILESELNEIPKLKDFASGHGDAQGYARLCGQEILLERLIKKARK